EAEETRETIEARDPVDATGFDAAFTFAQHCLQQRRLTDRATYPPARVRLTHQDGPAAVDDGQHPATRERGRGGAAVQGGEVKRGKHDRRDPGLHYEPL